MYSEAPLSFVWSVRDIQAATLSNSTSLSASPHARFANNGSVLEISTRLLLPGRAYSVSVFVSSVLNRSSMASQTILTTSAFVPDVTIGTSSQGKHDPAAQLVLQSIFDSKNASLSYMSWECESANLNMSDRSLFRSGLDGRNLVVAPSSLVAGSVYRFRFSVSVVGGGLGAAGVAVIVNSPPAQGTCGASPPTGTALQTRFKLQCSGWNDEDVPLRYKFQVAATDMNVCEFRLLEYYETLLPATSSGAMRAVIIDDFGASAQALFNVIVSQPVQLDLSSAEREISERLAEGDTQSFAVLCAGTANYLKASDNVNASAATGARASLLTSIEELVNATVSSEDADWGTLVANLVEAVTDFQHPSEITDSTNQKRAIDLLESVVGSNRSVIGKEAIMASSTAVTHIVSAMDSDQGLAVAIARGAQLRTF